MENKMYSRKDSSEISELISLQGDPHQIIADEIGPAFSEYRNNWEEAVHFRKKLPYPLHIDFEISFQCNLRCQMCVMGLPKEDRVRYGDPKKKLDFKAFKTIIDEGVQLGLKSVGFNGLNEPLLERDLIKWIKYAKEKRVIDIMFNTNGLLLNESTAREFILSGLTRMMISIDAATPETYGKIRRGGDFYVVKQNIENFINIRRSLKRRLPILRVAFVKMKNNIHELEKFKQMWQNKVDFLSIQTFTNPLVPGEKYYEDYEKFHLEQKEGKKTDFKCPQPWVRLMVRYNGDINPCCGVQGPKLVFGNIYTDNIEKIWNSRKMKFIRDIHANGEYKKNKICKLCAESSHYEGKKSGR